jgi:poly(ADP-ribose) glycohydrolase ARH3
MKKDVVSDRFTGSLLGLAIGDALGAPMDGLSPYDIHRYFGSVDAFFEPRDGKREAGTFTRHTQCTMIMTSAICGSVGKSLRENIPPAFADAAKNARDWDAETRFAAERASKGLPFDQCGSISATGSFLPRAIPMGLAAGARNISDEALLKGCEVATSFTHRGRGQALAAFVIAKVVRDCIRRDAAGSDEMPDPYGLYRSNQSLLSRIVLFCRSQDDADGLSIADRLDFTRKKLNTDATVEEFVGKHGNGDNFAEALCFSLFCFFRNYDEMAAVKRAASCGRAASLNASIVGGLVGAYCGTPFIPKDMYDDLEGSPTIVERSSRLFDVVYPKE